MLKNISGSDNEFQFVKYLNNKKISELNPLFRDLIDELFPLEKEDSIIKSWRNHYNQTSDIFIKINGIMKGISIKKGIKNSILVDRISDFIHFLIENKIDREIIIEYLKYQYAYGSTNGKGLKRLSVEEYKKDNQNNIDKINKALNKEKILNEKDIYSTDVHFGPITCQSKNRCLNYNPKYEKDRFCVQLKWYNLFDDILENMNNKVNKSIVKL